MMRRALRSGRLSYAGALLGGALISSLPVAANEVDPASLYEVHSTGSSTRIKHGDTGTFVLEIRTKKGAHVSEEAPLKLELKGQGVTPAKTKLALADSVTKKSPGQAHVDPRFEVALQAERPGQGSVDAKLTFFICTDTLCARQQRKLAVPVEISP